MAIVTGGQRVGIVQFEESAEAIFLYQIEVLPEFQGVGVGTTVVQSLIDRCERERKPLSLQVFRTNLRARRLYERLGFVVSNQIDPSVEMTYTPGTP